MLQIFRQMFKPLSENLFTSYLIIYASQGYGLDHDNVSVDRVKGCSALGSFWVPFWKSPPCSCAKPGQCWRSSGDWPWHQEATQRRGCGRHAASWRGPVGAKTNQSQVTEEVCLPQSEKFHDRRLASWSGRTNNMQSTWSHDSCKKMTLPLFMQCVTIQWVVRFKVSKFGLVGVAEFVKSGPCWGWRVAQKQ